jgi:uncharacterized protein (UPF0332 family)
MGLADVGLREYRYMVVYEHIQTAQDFLAASEREFAAGDLLQGSEKLWGAAAHAAIALAQQRGWPHRSHRSQKNAIERFSEENDDPLLASDFGVAEKFHRNFYHDDMEDFELAAERPKVRRFVMRALALIG